MALVNDEWVVWNNTSDVFFNISQWGWIHLVVGIVVVLAGVGLLSGNMMARAIAVALAAFSILANFLFMPAYPSWTLTVITLDVLVIWAITAHGREMRSGLQA